MIRACNVLAISLFVTMSTVACQSSPKSADDAATKATKVETKTPEAKAPAADQKTPVACAGKLGPGSVETLEIAGTKWELNGSTLTLKQGGPDKALRIGALSDVKDGSAGNLANIEKIVAHFKGAKVDLVLLAGDTGESEPQIKAVVEALGTIGVPVLVVIGNRESTDSFNKALASARISHKNVFNLNYVRRVNTGLVNIISLPGYYNHNYLHAVDGCFYGADQVNELAALIKDASMPTLLVSHGGPRQTGADAIDFTSQGANVGDPALAQAIASNKINFGVFGNVQEAGGRATDLTGNQLLKEGEFYEQLFLNPGPADSLPWQMNDKSESIGMAAVVTIEGGKAAYSMYRLNGPAK